MTVTGRGGVGVVLALLYRVTVPGVVLHELAHQFVAELFDLEIREVDYTSHVEHETPRSVLQAVLVAVAPLVVNTAFGAAALYLAAGRVPFAPGDLRPGAYDAAMLFVAFSLFFRAMPSVRDVRNVFSGARRRLTWYRPHVLLVVLLLAPALVPLYAGLRLAKATGTRVVVDLGYAALAFALAMGAALPLPTAPLPVV